MSAFILSPSPADHRATLADWLEITALSSERNLASIGDLRGSLSLEDDSSLVNRSDLLDELIENIVDNAFVILEHRENSCGTSYPFKVTRNGNGLVFCGENLTTSQYVYIFCLLVSCYREKTCLDPSVFDGLEGQIEDLFQVCGTIAAAGFVNGASISFGSPRPTSEGFIEALHRTFKKLSEGSPVARAPAGKSPHQKDAGIDIVAWRPFRDGLPGQIVLLGQCASGNNWRGKSIQAIKRQFLEWFTRPPASPTLDALFIPFSVDTVVKPAFGRSYEEERIGKYMDLTLGLGIIFDRCRVPLHVKRGLVVAKLYPGCVERSSDIPAVELWVKKVAQALRTEF